MLEHAEESTEEMENEKSITGGLTHRHWNALRSIVSFTIKVVCDHSVILSVSVNVHKLLICPLALNVSMTL